MINPDSFAVVEPVETTDPYTLARERHVDPDGWRGAYVEFDPESGKMLIFGQSGFWDCLGSPQALWDAIVQVRDEGLGVLRKEHLVPRAPDGEKERAKVIRNWLANNEPTRSVKERRAQARALTLEELDL
jgi:hypothetical protein